MVHVECYSAWDLEVEEDHEIDDDVGESKSFITFYLDPRCSYKKEWWYTNSSNSSDSYKNKQLVYRIEEYVDVTENYVENIDMAEMLSTPASDAALTTLVSEKVLVALEPAASQDALKELVSELISETRRRLAAIPSNNKCSFSIAIMARYEISISLDKTDVEELEEYKGAAADEYDSSLMPLPILIDDGYDFYELSQESCAICWDKYLPGSQVIRMQCLDEVDHLIHNSHHHHHVHHQQCLSFRGSDVTVMPCKHQFHANCITNWLKSSDSCPLCRFQMPSCATLLAILDLFTFIADVVID